MSYILAIDQGTTSSKALLLDKKGRIRATSRNFGVDAAFPQSGWVEFDPAQMLQSVVLAAKDALAQAQISFEDVFAVGLANQGETVLAFDADTGEPVCPAISWQDKRTSDIISQWRADGLESEVVSRAGLRLDPYFSAAKMRWILDNVPRASELLRERRLRLGTSDAWLLWQLGGRFITDVSTASRAMLLNLKTLRWDEKLLQATGIPFECLPEIVPNAEHVCELDRRFLGRGIPITGLCVDQQAALFGQRCFLPGQAKATYGTGCFVQANAGRDASIRKDGVLTSVGWRIGDDISYVLDGGIYSAGSILNWLRDEMKLYQDFKELESFASSVDDTNGVFLIPAFAGLGSPYWQPDAKAAWVGLTLSVQRAHLARAALEAIAFRVKDVVDAMSGPDLTMHTLQVDGGVTKNDFLMQLQADLLGIPICRSGQTEATALGVALMAGIGAGASSGTRDLPEGKAMYELFTPRKGNSTDELLSRYEQWRRIAREMIRCPV